MTPRRTSKLDPPISLMPKSTTLLTRPDLIRSPHVLNPTFAGSPDVGGADADLVIDGCLIDIKATVNPKLDPDFLYQLAGYLLLDYDDQLHIDTVGIYMARQGMLFTWSVADFLRQVTGDDTISLVSLRREFRTLYQNNRR